MLFLTIVFTNAGQYFLLPSLYGGLSGFISCGCFHEYAFCISQNAPIDDNTRLALFSNIAFSALGHVGQAKGEITTQDTGLLNHLIKLLIIDEDRERGAKMSFQKGHSPGYPLKDRLTQLYRYYQHDRELMLFLWKFRWVQCIRMGNYIRWICLQRAHTLLPRCISPLCLLGVGTERLPRRCGLGTLFVRRGRQRRISGVSRNAAAGDSANSCSSDSITRRGRGLYILVLVHYMSAPPLKGIEA